MTDFLEGREVFFFEKKKENSFLNVFAVLFFFLPRCVFFLKNDTFFFSCEGLLFTKNSFLIRMWLESGFDSKWSGVPKMKRRSNSTAGSK